MNIRLVVLIFAFMTCACERAVQTSQVQIRLPDFSGSGPAAAGLSLAPTFVNQLVANSVQQPNEVRILSLLENQWNPQTPTGYRGERNLNCFVALASAPDINQHSCFRDLAKVLSYAVMSQPVTITSGEPILLDVQSGNARVFQIWGMHADTSADCKQFGKSGTEYNHLSKPYLVASSAATNISAATVINMQMQVPDVSQYFDSCDWSDMINTQPSLPFTANHVDYRVETEILGGNFLIGKCVPVKLTVKDSTGQIVVMNPNNFSYSLYGTADHVTPRKTYASAYDCTQDLNGSMTLTFQNEYETTRWISGDTVLAGSSLDFTNSTVASMPFTRQHLSMERGQSSNITLVPVSVVPEYIHNGSCVPFSFALRSVDFSQKSDFSAGGSTFQAYILVGASVISFHADSDCVAGPPAGTTVNSNSISYAPTTDYSRTVYVKFVSGFTAGQIIQTLVDYNAGISRQSQYFSRVLESPTAPAVTSIKISGPTQFLSSVTSGLYCLGPFKVATVDALGVETIGSTQTQVDLAMLNSTEGMQIFEAFKNRLPCDIFVPSTEVFPGFSFNVGGASRVSSKLFYLKLKSSTPKLTQFFYANDGVVLHRGVLAMHFNIDATVAPPVEDSPARCSGSLCTTAPN